MIKPVGPQVGNKIYCKGKLIGIVTEVALLLGNDICRYVRSNGISDYFIWWLKHKNEINNLYTWEE